LPGFEIIKDLVVDMEPFWDKYAGVQPWLHAEMADSKERCMSERQRERVDQYVNCILCGLCCAACPAAALNERFTGPAALARLYRFLADPRENRDAPTLRRQDTHDGAWGCRSITRCIEVCPKNVRPFDGIAGVRRSLLAQKFSRFLRRRRHED
jgi:succinate dehydrogenase / fumarate reductase iron-sulfur subunit